MESIDALIAGESIDLNSTSDSNVNNDASTPTPTPNQNSQTYRRMSDQSNSKFTNDKPPNDLNNVAHNVRYWQRSSVASSIDDESNKERSKQEQEVILKLILFCVNGIIKS